MYVTRRGIRISIVVAVGLAGAGAALAQSSYAVTDLGTLGGRNWCNDLNEHGDVVGQSEVVSSHAFLWRLGDIVDLHPQGEPGHSAARGINNDQEIIGDVFEPNGSRDRIVMWTPSGFVDLGREGFGLGINDAQQMLIREPDNISFVLLDGDIETSLGGIVQGRAVNESGLVAGVVRVFNPKRGTYDFRHGYWNGNEAVALRTLGAESGGEAADINDAGAIVGWTADANARWVGVLWEDDEITATFSLGGRDSKAYAINNRFEIAGMSWTERGDYHMFMADPAGIIDIDPLLPAGPAKRISTIQGMNDAGQIAANFYRLDGTPGSLLLTPRPCNDLIIGDANCDGELNAFDIEPFIAALFEPQTYADTYGCNWLCMNDINADGAVDAFDIEPFLSLLFP